jgi:hypothetical protein
VIKVRSHRVNPNRGKTHGRKEHTRAPKPGARQRIAKPISLPRRANKSGGGGGAPGKPAGSSQKVRVASIASGVGLAVLATTVVVGAGSPLLVAAVILVLYGAAPRSS